ncbi:hypothetical protein C8R42DRAFT_681430 [Lentinula raphanica]|nr:hypothetical protein C8R42DRAFT_681430 [Lentinula raphanica]
MSLDSSSSPSVQISPVAGAEVRADGDDLRQTSLINLSWTKQSINLILVGETGVGKTAMVNLLANVCAGIPLEKFDDKVDLSNELGGKEAAGSQTIAPKFYSIICANGQRVNILDTPGFADERGIEFDRVHKQALVQAMKEHIDSIDAIVVLLHGDSARLDTRTEYALATIFSVLDTSLADNIVFIFTNVSSPSGFNFPISLLPNWLQSTPRWSTDNPCIRWFAYRKALSQPSGTVDEDSLEDMNDVAHRGYHAGLKMLSQFFQHLDKCQPKPIQGILQLYELSMYIETHVSNIIARSELLAVKRATNVGKEIEKLEQEIDASLTEVVDACERYNKLSLAGSFVRLLYCTIHMLQYRDARTRKLQELAHGVTDSEVLDRLARSIGRIQKQVKVLEEVDRRNKKA